MSKNEVCWCGRDTFHVRIDANTKNHIWLVCAACNCERRVKTPFFSGSYVVEPPLKSWEIVEKPSGQIDTMQRTAEVVKA